MARFRRKRAGRRSRVRRIADIVGVILLFALTALAAAVFDELSMQDMSGKAYAVDGDTIRLHGERIRLAGIDAPELDQQCLRGGISRDCGREAQRHLARLIATGKTDCRGNERDRYGRLLMRCICDEKDVNRAMVLAGWAVAYGDYGDAERAARRDRSGLWAGEFDRPSDWRARRGALADTGPAGLASRLLFRLRSAFGLNGEEENT